VSLLLSDYRVEKLKFFMVYKLTMTVATTISIEEYGRHKPEEYWVGEGTPAYELWNELANLTLQEMLKRVTGDLSKYMITTSGDNDNFYIHLFSDKEIITGQIMLRKEVAKHWVHYKKKPIQEDEIKRLETRLEGLREKAYNLHDIIKGVKDTSKLENLTKRSEELDKKCSLLQDEHDSYVLELGNWESNLLHLSEKAIYITGNDVTSWISDEERKEEKSIPTGELNRYTEFLRSNLQVVSPEKSGS